MALDSQTDTSVRIIMVKQGTELGLHMRETTCQGTTHILDIGNEMLLNTQQLQTIPVIEIVPDQLHPLEGIGVDQRIPQCIVPEKEPVPVHGEKEDYTQHKIPTENKQIIMERNLGLVTQKKQDFH